MPRYPLFFLILLTPLFARAQDGAPVRSYLEGQLKVHADIDSTGDYSGFEIIVANRQGTTFDTLGYARTDTSGRFATDVQARQRGIFPLLIKRDGTILNVSQLVVVQGDSAHLRATLPLGERTPLVRSQENSAWRAYTNTEAQHNQLLLELLKAGQNSVGEVSRTVELTASMLWGLRETFPGTMGSTLAAVKSITMLDGWNDSLLVARMQTLPLNTPGLIEALRAARRAEARLHGQEAALDLVRRYQAQLENPEQKAVLQTEIVQAYVDSTREAEAVAAATQLKTDFPGTRWAEWADRAIYEATTLLPGKPMPAYALADTAGTVLFDTAAMQGQYYVLEFWTPRDVQYPRQLPQVASVMTRLKGRPFSWVFIGLEPDPGLYQAFFEQRDTYGQQFHAPADDIDRLSALYNLSTLPTRFLVDDQGRIVGKYTGSVLLNLEAELVRLLPGEDATPTTPTPNPQ